MVVHARMLEIRARLARATGPDRLAARPAARHRPRATYRVGVGMRNSRPTFRPPWIQGFQAWTVLSETPK